MNERQIVKLYTSPTIIPKKAFPDLTDETFELDIKQGSRLVLCLEVFAIDPATIVTLRIKNTFSIDATFQTIKTFAAVSIGIQKTVLVDFHNFVNIQLVVSGGSATVAFGLTSNDNANVNGPESLPSHRPIKYRTEFLESGGSLDMTVDGSVTPVIFEKIFTTGEIVFIEKLAIEIRDSGGSALGDFGSGPALTNGILIEVQIGGIIEMSINIKTNGELISAADVIFEITQFQGSALLVYNFVFREPLSLNHNNNDDFLRVTIQDDLSGIQDLQMAFKRREVI